MPISVTHTFVSPVTDAGDPNEVGPNEWNAAHTVTGAVAASAESYNRLVNGAMQINQEGVTTIGVSGAYYVLDQWFGSWSMASGTFHGSSSSGPPGGSPKALLIYNDSGGTVAAGSYFSVQQPIEGLRVDDFLWGTAYAKQVIVRFSMLSSTAGAYTMYITNGDATRSYCAAFTVSAANTWQTFTFAVPGDTTGTWVTTSAVGLKVGVTYACGANFIGVAGWQAGNKIAIAGQVNGGATTNGVMQIAEFGLYLDRQNTGAAPAWQMPDYTEELIKCQRYFANNLLSQFAGNVTSGVGYYGIGAFPVFTRTTPAVTGVHENSYSFPTSPGSYSIVGGTSVRELRTANQSASGHFSSIMTVNARM